MAHKSSVIVTKFKELHVGISEPVMLRLVSSADQVQRKARGGLDCLAVLHSSKSKSCTIKWHVKFRIFHRLCSCRSSCSSRIWKIGISVSSASTFNQNCPLVQLENAKDNIRVMENQSCASWKSISGFCNGEFLELLPRANAQHPCLEFVENLMPRFRGP